ncbi:MAG: protein kinase [Acidobacteria bacterium]|nr:protein kinase [Acidobacteriota bacterium]
MSESIGHFDILGLIGSGGHSTVYRARDTRVGRTVAIRLLSPALSDPLQRARAIDVIHSYTALSHPHVATLFEVGEHRGSIYLVYEFVPGDTLPALTHGSPLNIRRALDLGSQIADALAEAHSADLVHGALTPTSVIVTPKGHAKVLDFGLSAWTREDGPSVTAERLASGNGMLGHDAVASMAPEQLLGQPSDHRADLFALGVLLYDMLTGFSPFASAKPGDAGVRVLQTSPAAPSQLNADVPEALDAVVMRALAKNPDERYQNAAAIASDLRTAASIEHGRDMNVDPKLLRVPVRRSPWRIAALGALLVAAIGVAGWQWEDQLRQAWQGRFGGQPDPVVVVLPFQVTGADVSRPYYGAGFADELARQLGQVPGLTVIGRSTIRAFAGRTPASVAADVRATLALTGALAPSDDEWKALRIDVRLTDGREGRVIWTRSYTGATEDVIAIQARIARDLGEWMRIGAPFGAQPGRTSLRLVDPVAYDLYLQARDALAANDPSRAAQLFENSITADPSLLEAHTGLVEALYTNAAFDGRVALADVQSRMREAAEAASTTDPDLPSTQLAMGLAARTVREAVNHLRRAIEIDRSYTAAYLALADVLREFEPARAVRFARKAVELDPRLARAHYQLAEDNIALGEFSEALVESARGQALAPSLPWWEALRLRIKLAQPAGKESLAGLIGRTPYDFPPVTILRAVALRTEGRAADAAGILAALTRLYPAACEAKAITAAVRYQAGERAEALRIATPLLADAESSGMQMAWTRCAALAAASVNDAPRAATWIARAASSDDGIRMWGSVNGVLSGSAGLRQRIFPWSNVTQDPEMRTAIGRLDTALARVRAETAKILEGF